MKKLRESIHRIRTHDWFLEMFTIYIGGNAFLYLVYAFFGFLNIPITEPVYFALGLGGIIVHVFLIVFAVFTIFHIRK